MNTQQTQEPARCACGHPRWRHLRTCGNCGHDSTEHDDHCQTMCSGEGEICDCNLYLANDTEATSCLIASCECTAYQPEAT